MQTPKDERERNKPRSYLFSAPRSVEVTCTVSPRGREVLDDRVKEVLIPLGEQDIISPQGCLVRYFISLGKEGLAMRISYEILHSRS